MSCSRFVAPKKLRLPVVDVLWFPETIMETNSIPYSIARKKIRDGDLLLFRRENRLTSRLIAAAGRSEYCHAAMAAWWNERLMCLETVQTHGGRAVMLSTAVAESPNLIDVYRIKATRRRFDPSAAVRAMIEITGKRYGWSNLLRAAMVHLPVLRMFTSPLDNDRANGTLPFCSDAVSRALRAGGIDPVPHLADAGTEPADLARSAAVAYRFTLSPDPKKEESCDSQDLDG
jgi:hypothetical protein